MAVLEVAVLQICDYCPETHSGTEKRTYLGRLSSTNTVDMRSSILVMFCCARVDTVLLLDDLTSVTKHNWICLTLL